MFSNGGSIPVTMNVAPTGSSNGGFGGFGDNGAWWLIILILIFGGWGWGGYGNGGFGGQGSTSVYEGYVLNNDFSILNKAITDQYQMTERKLDGISNGLCDGFYTQAQLINGLDKSIANGTYSITSAITQDTIANMQNTNALATQMSQCCCDTKQLIGDVKYTIGSTSADTNYNIATQANMLDRTVSDKFCQTNFNMQTNTRDIVDSQNAGTQAILAKLNDMETERLREKLESERDAKYALQGQLDRAELRTAIVNDVRPCPIPAYPACNPWGCNCNQGCGC